MALISLRFSFDIQYVNNVNNARHGPRFPFTRALFLFVKCLRAKSTGEDLQSTEPYPLTVSAPDDKREISVRNDNFDETRFRKILKCTRNTRRLKCARGRFVYAIRVFACIFFPLRSLGRFIFLRLCVLFLPPLFVQCQHARKANGHLHLIERRAPVIFPNFSVRRSADIPKRNDA